MPLDITCQYCGKNFRISDEVAGKHFRCVGCQEVLKAPPLADSGRSARPNAASSSPQRSSTTGQKPRPKSPSQSNKRGERPGPARNQTRQLRPAVPDDDDFIDDEFAQDDPFNYEGPVEASWNDMPGGPVGQPRRKQKVKPKARRAISRESHHEAFAEYDSIVNEIAIFWIGLGILVGGFAVLFSTAFWDGAGDQERQKIIIEWTMGIAASMIFIGLITFTKSKIWLYVLFFICALYLLATVILALMLGRLLFVLPAAFCVMYVRLGKALSAHP